jgi:saccharopine dehydrogenase-like NADP-dependent oxidoreductase
MSRTIARFDGHFASAQVDASDETQLAELIASTGPDAVLNATDPRFNEPIFNACFATGTTYLADYGATHGVDERAP